MKIKIFLIVILLLKLNVYAQNSKKIAGKIIVKEGFISNVLVLNLKTEQETKSDANGSFTIDAQLDDLIVFQSGSLEYLRHSIDNTDFEKEFFEITMTAKPIQLEEVKIFDYSGINAVSMGILSRPAKVYTPAERKLQTATRLYPSLYAGAIAGGSIGLDPLINAITGRTKMLKKFVAMESVQIRVSKLQNWFSDEYAMQTLKISEFRVKGFWFYAAEDAAIIEALQLKNKFLASFALGQVAEKYNSFQK